MDYPTIDKEKKVKIIKKDPAGYTPAGPK